MVVNESPGPQIIKSLVAEAISSNLSSGIYIYIGQWPIRAVNVCGKSTAYLQRCPVIFQNIYDPLECFFCVFNILMLHDTFVCLYHGSCGLCIILESYIMKYMNPFKSFTLKWWQGGLLKIALISLGIAIGANWPELFADWINALLILFLILAGYITIVWWKQ